MGQLKLLPAATQITDGSTGQTAATSATWFSGTRPLPAVSRMEVGAILATAVTRTIPTATTSATIPLAATISQGEHDLIKERLTIMDGGAFVSYWLGGVDYFEEGVWQWSNGDPWSFTNWHEGEPNNVDNEDCLS